MAKIVGIDLGTTKSALAVWREDRPEIVRNAEGQAIMPSVVAFDRATGRWVVGEPARALGLDDPRGAVYSIKRFMGRRIRDRAVQENIQSHRILYELVESHDHPGAIEVAVGNLRLTPQELSAKILQKLKADAELQLGYEITQAVITVPAYFDDQQRQATRDAGLIAGLIVKQVFNEPTAACLAFGYSKLRDERKTVAVYDLGGGTFDISILEVGQGPFWVRATNGDTHLGGNDLDWLIVDWALEGLGAATRAALVADIGALAHLRAAAEMAKRDLSVPEARFGRVQVPGTLGSPVCVQDLDVELSRETLDRLAKDWIQATLAPCQQALRDAGLKPGDIQEVLLVGGQTRMPAVRQAVRDFFGLEPNLSLNPEEVVALGAAVRAAILAGEVSGLKLADVVPLSLGVKTHGGKMDVLIPRNTQLPVAETRSYSTFWANQDSVDVQVYQGERAMVADNVALGKFTLGGIDWAPAGEPDIQITFRVDENGILEVTGQDMQTGKLQKLRITESTRLNDEEIEEMIRDAREHQFEDAARLRQSALRERAEAIQISLTGVLAEKENILPAELVAAIREVLGVAAPVDWAARLAVLEALWKQASSPVHF